MMMIETPTAGGRNGTNGVVDRFTIQGGFALNEARAPFIPQPNSAQMGCV